MMTAIFLFARTRVGMAVIAGALILFGASIWLYRHNQRIIADHDAKGAADVQQRVNESIRRGDAVPDNPDDVQRNDPRCRDCGR